VKYVVWVVGFWVVYFDASLGLVAFLICPEIAAFHPQLGINADAAYLSERCRAARDTIFCVFGRFKNRS
jgi:hypothetical protein